MPVVVENLVSTIIPVYNRSKLLVEAVKSVLAQTYKPIEIIISNDGSTDDAGKVADKFVSKYPQVIRALHHQNGGVGLAREAGRLVAKGEFIQYLDSDDLLLPDKFKVQVKALRDNQDCGAAYGFIRFCPENGPPRKAPHKWSGRTLGTLFPYLLVDRWWNTNAPLFRRSVCDLVGPWTDLKYSQDWEYDARVGALGTRLVHCKRFVCDQRHHLGPRQTGHGNWLKPSDQVRFFYTLYQSATQAGVNTGTIEMAHFARWVFLQARICGAMGDPVAAQALYQLAWDASKVPDCTLKVVGLLAKFIGWRLTGKVFQLRDKLTGNNVGQHTLKQSWMS